MRTPESLIVLIPTRDRPKLLRLTIVSVLEQAALFGHKHVQIVVSDPASNTNNQKINKCKIDALRNKYNETPIYYYGSGMPDPINQLLAQANTKQREAYSQLIPEDGDYGAHRNRLALLAVYHGGKASAYLHLDDDTPVMKQDKRPGREGSIMRHHDDVISYLLGKLRSARRAGMPGYAARLEGIVDGFLSMNNRSGQVVKSLKEELHKSNSIHCVTFGTGDIGPGRIVVSEVMKIAYRPRGINEDLRHARDVLAKWKIRKRSRSPYLLPDYDMPQIVHIGISGYIPDQRRRKARTRNWQHQYRDEWASLIGKMMRLKDKQQSST